MRIIRSFSVAAFTFGSMLAALANGIAPRSVASTAPSPKFRLTIVADGPILRPDAGPLTAIVPADLQFDPKLLTVALSAHLEPHRRTPFKISWSLSNGLARLGASPYDNPFAIASAPPGGTLVSDMSYGESTITARVDAPVSISTSIPIFIYRSFAIGGNFRNPTAMRFDPSPEPSVSTVDDDLYFTGSTDWSESSRSSDSAFATPRPTLAIHVPYGATLVTDGMDSTHTVRGGVWAPEFPYIDASYWQNSFTSIDADLLAQEVDPCNLFGKLTAPCAVPARRVLLLKTKFGRIVKLGILVDTGDEIIGVYQVSELDRTFSYPEATRSSVP